MAAPALYEVVVTNPDGSDEDATTSSEASAMVLRNVAASVSINLSNYSCRELVSAQCAPEEGSDVDEV